VFPVFFYTPLSTSPSLLLWFWTANPEQVGSGRNLSEWMVEKVQIQIYDA